MFKSDEEAAAYVNNKGNRIQPNAKGGDAKFIDWNGDGIIDDNDRTSIGQTFPWLTYGFNAGFEYRNFDLQFFFQGIYGNEIYNAVREKTEGNGNEATLSKKMVDVWTINNPNGTIPQPSPFGNADNSKISSRYIESGAYLRLKNVQLAYTFPLEIVQHIGMQKLRLYISGSNLLTFTKYTGYDPEIGSGVDYGNYPQAQTVLVGANITF